MKYPNRWQKPLILMSAFAVFAGCSGPDDRSGDAGNADAAMDTLVSAAWLREHLDEPDLVVIDSTVLIEQDEHGGIRSVNGRANYEAGHVPNAGFADLMGNLSDADSPLEFAVPTPEQFAAAMGALGVGDDTRVVLYDANGSVWAARVWWMLRWIGFDRAALLDGGLSAWTAEGGSLSTEPSTHPARTLTPNVRPELIAHQDEVRASIEDDAIKLIDALPASHYRGEMSMYDQPGHIPGAANVPVFSLLDEDGRYKSHDELAEIFDGDRNTRTITYCGGGIAASSDAFIMTRLGFTDVAIYAASLQEWAADPDNPMDVVLDWDESDD